MEWPLLASLDPVEQRRVLSSGRRRSFDKGEVICHQGDPADSLHLIESGRLCVRISTHDGATVMLNLLSPGDFFGELSLLHDKERRRRTATVACLEPSRTFSLSTREFQTLREEHPAIGILLTTALASRVEELSARLVEALYVGLDRRVVRALLRLGRVYGRSGGPVVIPLTQTQLADLVGGARPSVNQVLTRLAAQNVVSVGRGRVVILDVATLRQKAGY